MLFTLMEITTHETFYSLRSCAQKICNKMCSHLGIHIHCLPQNGILKKKIHTSEESK